MLMGFGVLLFTILVPPLATQQAAIPISGTGATGNTYTMRWLRPAPSDLPLKFQSPLTWQASRNASRTQCPILDALSSSIPDKLVRLHVHQLADKSS
jgi:hypothetical protein